MQDASTGTPQDSGKQSGEPVLTPETKNASDATIKKMAAKMMSAAPKVMKSSLVSEHGTPSPNSIMQGRVADGGKNGEQGGEGQKKDDTSSSSPSPDKADVPGSEKKKEPVQAKGSETISEDARKFQSLADTRLQELNTTKEELKKLKEQQDELGKKAKLVEQFTADPLSFIQHNLPELGEQLRHAGNPVAAIESEVSKYVEQLQTEYRKEFGDNWKYNEIEALKPGTPSFRYKLAVDAKISETRGKHTQYIQDRQRHRDEWERRKVADKEQMKKDFGFSDEQIAEAEAKLDKIQITPYLMYQMAMLDEIIKSRVGAIVPAPPPPPDIVTDTKGNRREGKEKIEISDATRKIVSRIGMNSFRR